MKKVLICIMCIIMMSTMVSCTCCTCSFDFAIEDEQKSTKKQMKAIVDALEKEDKKALKSMFSKNVVESVKEIDDQIDAVMAYFEGEVEDISNRTVDKSIVKKNDEKTEKAVMSYDVKTSVCTYQFCVISIISDENKPENQGVYSVFIRKSFEDKPKDAYIVNNQDFPGIFIDVR